MRAGRAPLRRPGRQRAAARGRRPPDSKENIHVPLGYLQLARTEVDWDYATAPEPNCNGRRISLPRGKVLGGSSSINAMIYIRGNRRDYDEWGIPGWGWDDLFPYFLKAEDNERGASEWHGAGGPLPVSDQRSGNMITPAFVEAGVEAGLARNEDFNGAEQDGVGMYQVTQRGGMRASAAVAYLHPAIGAAEPDRDALHAREPGPVRGHPRGRGRGEPARPGPGAAGRARGDPLRRRLQLAAAADALRRRPGRAPGDARDRGAARPAGGRREPQRPRRRLRRLDHARSRRACCWRWSRRRWRSSTASQTGPFASNLAEAGGFARVEDGAAAPDVQFHVAPVQIVDEGMGDPHAHGVWVSPCLLTPESRGSVRLASNDPTAKPIVRNDFYAAEDDCRGWSRRCGWRRRSARSRRCAPYCAERFTTPAGDSDDDLRAHVARTTFPIYHPVGTCAIGSVVDAELRVQGLEGLRVVDASVMPAVPRGNTNAPTIAIAERAADLIKGAAPLQGGAESASAA